MDFENYVWMFEARENKPRGPWVVLEADWDAQHSTFLNLLRIEAEKTELRRQGKTAEADALTYLQGYGETPALSIKVNERTVQVGTVAVTQRSEHLGHRAPVYEYANAFVLCYRAAKRRSFANAVEKWLPVMQAANATAPVVVLALTEPATEADMPTVGSGPFDQPVLRDGTEYGVVPRSDGEALARSIGAIGFVETCWNARDANALQPFEMLMDALRRGLRPPVLPPVPKLQFVTREKEDEEVRDDDGGKSDVGDWCGLRFWRAIHAELQQDAAAAGADAYFVVPGGGGGKKGAKEVEVPMHRFAAALLSPTLRHAFNAIDGQNRLYDHAAVDAEAADALRIKKQHEQHRESASGFSLGELSQFSPGYSWWSVPEWAEEDVAKLREKFDLVAATAAGGAAASDGTTAATTTSSTAAAAAASAPRTVARLVVRDGAFSAKALQHLVKFIYTGLLPGDKISDSQEKELRELATLLQLDKLNRAMEWLRKTPGKYQSGYQPTDMQYGRLSDLGAMLAKAETSGKPLVFSDVVVGCRDGKQLPVPRFLLAHLVPDSELRRAARRGDDAALQLPDYDIAAVYTLLRFAAVDRIYLRHDASYDALSGGMRLGHHLALPRFVHSCGLKLWPLVTIANVAAVMQLAVDTDCAPLLEYTRWFAALFFTTLVAADPTLATFPEAHRDAIRAAGFDPQAATPPPRVKAAAGPGAAATATAADATPTGETPNGKIAADGVTDGDAPTPTGDEKAAAASAGVVDFDDGYVLLQSKLTLARLGLIAKDEVPKHTYLITVFDEAFHGKQAKQARRKAAKAKAAAAGGGGGRGCGVQ